MYIIMAYIFLLQGYHFRERKAVASPLLSSGTSEVNPTSSEYQPSSQPSSVLLSPSQHSTHDWNEYQDRLELLQDYCQSLGLEVEPLESPWEELPAQTRVEHVEQVANILSHTLKIIAGPDSTHLWQAVKGSAYMKRLMHEEDEIQLGPIAESYLSSDNRHVKKQILSIIAQKVTFEDAEQAIPGLTRYHFKNAQEHAREHGPGNEVKPRKINRNRVSDKKLDHLVNYMVSPHVVTDLPFGMKQMKLSTGVKIEVPNVVRNIIPEEFVRQYHIYCNETNFTPLGRSTILAVLNSCSASTRKCLAGLDYYSTDATDAFVTLESVLEQLPGNLVELRNDLLAYKTYLKGDFKVRAIRFIMLE